MRGGYNGRRKRCGVKAAKAQIIGNYCSVIIAASFSGFITQLLMAVLGVAILVTSFFCLYIEMIHKLEGWKARNKTKVN